MGTVNLKTASGGSVILSPTNTAVDTTITVPASNGTMAINGPAFSAYQSSGQTLASGTATKIQFQTEEFDTASCFDNTTNYRFTPTVAGYYQVSGAVGVGASATGIYVSINKNGVQFKNGVNTSGNSYSANVSTLVYLNGTSDYVELYAYFGVGQVVATGFQTYFSGAMVRSA